MGRAVKKVKKWTQKDYLDMIELTADANWRAGQNSVIDKMMERHKKLPEARRMKIWASLTRKFRSDCPSLPKTGG